MRIAIASSGLGHVARGIETWALDTANSLSNRGAAVTLFAAGDVASSAPLVTIPCIRRRTTASRSLVRLMPGFMWRWGLKDGYGLEQFTFWRHLREHIQKGQFDILHVQDPMIAFWCRRARKAGRLHTCEILAHGTEEPLSFLSQFDFLQHLAPWHLKQAQEALGVHENWTALPNFVDTDRYHPANDVAEKRRVREELGLPVNAWIIGTSAAIKKTHKRIDYLIGEFAHFSSQCSTSGDSPSPYLVIAGSEQNDTAELRTLATRLCPERIKFCVNTPQEKMPELLRCYDVFVLTSLFEMMPIAVLEAIATGLPVVLNKHPVLEWMGGSGGLFIDMGVSGALAATLLESRPQDSPLELGRQARQHALTEFSADAVLAKYLDYYQQVIAAAGSVEPPPLPS